MNDTSLSSVIGELERQARRHGEMSVYPRLAAPEGMKFWKRYAAHLAKAGIPEDQLANVCISFSRRCQDAWLDYHRRRLAREDKRDWSRIATAFEQAIKALDEAGSEFENAIELYGRLNGQGVQQRSDAVLREQLQRAAEYARMNEAYFDHVARGPRTEARRFASHLARACNAIPPIPLPTQPMISQLIALVYGVEITNREISTATKSMW
jgi:hypothetical protein